MEKQTNKEQIKFYYILNMKTIAQFSSISGVGSRNQAHSVASTTDVTLLNQREQLKTWPDM